MLNLIFKRHIAGLFYSHYECMRLEALCSGVFEYDPEAEVRIRINGEVYFIQITDMQQAKGIV